VGGLSTWVGSCGPGGDAGHVCVGVRAVRGVREVPCVSVH